MIAQHVKVDLMGLVHPIQLIVEPCRGIETIFVEVIVIMMLERMVA